MSECVVPANSTAPRVRLASSFSVQPPFDPRLAPVAQIVRDLVEQDIRAVDGTVGAAHALVLDDGLDRRAGGGVVERDAAAAVGVGVGEGAHELKGERDGEVGVRVDDRAARAEPAVPVRHVADARRAGAFARAGCGARRDGAGCGSWGW